MVFLCSGVDTDVIQVDQGELQVQVSETILHDALKCSWHIAQSVRHSKELVHTHASYGECHVLAGLLRHLYLPKPALEVHGGEIPDTH